MADSGGNLQTIDIEFETLQDFREIMAPRLNYEGFFIEKPDPLPRGTRAQFRFVLPDGYVLAEGTGVVTWSRYEDESPEERAGMALLFDALDQQNREVVDELVEFHRSTGGEPFDLGPRASEAGEIATDALSGDVFEVPPPPDSAVPTQTETVSESTGAAAEQSADYLPDWLSEVAQKHDVEYLENDTAPVDDDPERVESPETVDLQETTEPQETIEDQEPLEIQEPAEPQDAAERGEVTRPAMPELDASLFTDEEPATGEPEEEVPDVVLLEQEIPDVGVLEEDVVDTTPIRDEVEPSPEVTLPSRDAVEKPRDLRLRYGLPVVAVLVAASAIVFWIVNRTIPLDVSEPAPVEEARTIGAPVAVEEEQGAETDSDLSVEPTGKPADVAETASDEPLAAERVAEEPQRPAATVPATRLLLVTATQVGEETVVTVRGNGELTESTVRVVLLKDPARVWVRITGIEAFYRPNEIVAGTPEVERLRIGHHPEETPQSIYVVADLASASATIRDHTIEGDTLRVVIAR